MNCVVSTGKDNQSSNTDSDTDGHDTGSVVGVESETMDSQPAFITDKLPHQSVSVGNDPETESSDSLCIAECCNGDRLYQPRINYSSVSKRKQGKCCRSFQSSWYGSFKWLSYCMTHNKVFCYYYHTATASL